MKVLYALLVVLTVTACTSFSVKRENAQLLERLKKSPQVTIRDWRSADGKSVDLSGPERDEFVSIIDLQTRKSSAESYCQCLGDFRVTFRSPDGASPVFFVCHWQHLSFGEELKVERQVYLTPESARRVKSFLLSRFPPRPGEEKEANKSPQTTRAFGPRV